jgi:hypothetical protein
MESARAFVCFQGGVISSNLIPKPYPRKPILTRDSPDATSRQGEWQARNGKLEARQTETLRNTIIMPSLATFALPKWPEKPQKSAAASLLHRLSTPSTSPRRQWFSKFAPHTKQLHAQAGCRPHHKKRRPISLGDARVREYPIDN